MNKRELVMKKLRNFIEDDKNYDTFDDYSFRNDRVTTHKSLDDDKLRKFVDGFIPFFKQIIKKQ